ncbi:MAG: hypothetical protein ACYTHM_21335 [Planctomycetota bacterium]|jgi:hypothetical protein
MMAIACNSCGGTGACIFCKGTGIGADPIEGTDTLGRCTECFGTGLCLACFGTVAIPSPEREGRNGRPGSR